MSLVPLVRNPTTGFVSPQYHVVFDDHFYTVFGSSSQREMATLERIIKGVSALEATRFDRSRKAAGSSFTVVLFYRRPISHTFDFHAHAREGVSLRVSPFLSNFIADARYNTYVGLAYLR